MIAATAREHQIRLYRRMTGEQRLAVALDLHELSCDIAREGIRRQHPPAQADEIERLLRQRIELSRELDQPLDGDFGPRQT
jgi:type II secretory pathway predicted ATPase ExeA